MYREIYLKNTYEEIVKIIEEGARVLDLGCGDGELLSLLYERRKIYGLGIDISTEEVLKCIKKGVSVIQEDIDEGLVRYKDESYDYVILSETLQTIKKPDFVLNQMVRIGKKAIVTFPNFAYWRNRLIFAIKGIMPKTDVLPFEWYNTPNIHLLTIKDFKNFCKANNMEIIKEFYLTGRGAKTRVIAGLENLLSEQALFIIRKKEEKKTYIR
ncbi:MAG TPA: methionine biosynthesis protein MetW [Candidatus Goldiibacteriota bacterium]|nr:methionine biosynthesis protein MetW [Candidatus Goldiibacteriota bacterium]